MTKPLAERLRPVKLDEISCQEHLLSKDGLIPLLIQGNRPLSILLWGPPGCGKTTLARLYAKAFEAPFFPFSASEGSIAELKKQIQDIRSRPLLYRQPLIFVDEIHRFNKSQQDLFLPLLEEGVITLIGATTENPSFAINSALLSRLRVLQLKNLDQAGLEKILDRYEKQFQKLPLLPEARSALIEMAQGDGRHLLNMVEHLEGIGETIDTERLFSLIQKRVALYDRQEDQHYNLISALHKSVRGSDPDAALYWFARMIQGGEDPDFLARRLVRMASEDIGLADPAALSLTIDAWEAWKRMGSPEGELALAEAVIYLALAPKSNAIYTAYKKALEAAAQSSQLDPPKIILNAPTPLMKEMDYGKGYLYDHDEKDGFSGQDYFPDALGRKSFYQPKERGFEREMKKRMDYFAKKKASCK